MADMGAAMRRTAAAVAAVLALGACDGSPTSVDATGELRFTFTGDSTGSFEAVGAITQGNTLSGTYAAASVERVTDRRFLSVIGQRRGPSTGTVDVLLLNMDDPAAGTVTCAAEAESCSFGVAFAAGTSPDDGDSDGFFLSREGSVTITRLDDRRVTGTFSSTVEEVVSEGEPRVIRVTGSFDVPVLSRWAR
jgi:hypothetical protein